MLLRRTVSINARQNTGSPREEALACSHASWTAVGRGFHNPQQVISAATRHRGRRRRGSNRRHAAIQPWQRIPRRWLKPRAWSRGAGNNHTCQDYCELGADLGPRCPQGARGSFGRRSMVSGEEIWTSVAQ